MWRPILICFSLVSLMNCTQTITCNPTLGINAGCPNSHPTCDPAGVCRQNCKVNADCTDPGTICDLYSSVAICQTECASNTDCQTGQTCFQYTIKATSSAVQDIPDFMCKRVCDNYSTAGAPAWCVAPNACTPFSTTNNGYICEGPPKA